MPLARLSLNGIKVEVDDYSLIPLFIEMYLEGGSESIAIGTCFSIEIKHQNYLITNWHNVTGRNPQTNNPISTGGIIDPDILKVWFFTNTSGLWIQKTIRLKNSGEKSWIKHPKGERGRRCGYSICSIT